VVRLTEDLTPSLKAGTRAVVVMVYGGNPPAYEVELFDDNHTTIGVETVRENQIRIDESVRG
jgi:hypothetical protein